MKNLLSKSAIALMALASVMFTSCENGPDAPPVKKGLSGINTEVLIGMEVKGTGKTKANPEKLGFDSDVPLVITNVFVVPAVDNIRQHAIKLEDNLENTSNPQISGGGTIANIDKSTNRFLVYGNIGTELSDGVAPDTTTLKFEAVSTNAEAAGMTGYYDPYPLYFFRDTETSYGTSAEKGYYAVESTDPWANNLFNSAALTRDAIGENTRIKIGGVTYAVGSLVVAIRDGYDDATAEYTVHTGDENGAIADWSSVIANDIKIAGIVVDRQPDHLKESFQSNSDEIKIFDGEVANPTIFAKGTDPAAFLDVYQKANPADKANLFVTVAQEIANTTMVTLNIKFQYTGTVNLVSVDKEDPSIVKTLQPNDYFYLAARITPTSGSGKTATVFAPTYTTLVNANVVKWNTWTSTPQESVDVQVGIEVDVTWHEGNVYDVEI